MMTLQELEKIRHALLYACQPEYTHLQVLAVVDDALEIVAREIDQMKQDQILSVSKANPT